MPPILVDIANASAFIPGDRERALVLRDINWQIERGGHAAISGPNGAGKSSLLKLIHGDLRPCAGRISWHDNGIMGYSAITARQICAFVSPQIQEYCQIHAWNVTGLAMLAGAGSDSPFAFANEPDNETLAAIHAITDRLEAHNLLALPLPSLSQGQLRLLLLARALLAKPALLLLDEWADGLDSHKRELLSGLMKDYAENMTMIFTSHREDGIPAWAPKRLYMENGRLLRKTQKNVERTGHKTLQCGQEHFQNELTLKDCGQSGKIVLRVSNASVYIDRQPVLRNINFTLRKGEHWQIGGPNGSGKSTFLRMLAGDEFVAAEGSYELWSDKCGGLAQSLEEKRAAISLVSDLSQALYGYNVSGLELVLSGIDNCVGLYRDYSGEEIARAQEMLAMFFSNPQEMACPPMRRLSTGQLRKLFLAKALMNRPEIVLLDEPCTGLDAQSRESYLDLLEKIACGKILGLQPQFIVVSHYGEDVPGFVNKRAVMEEGKLIRKAKPSAVCGCSK